MSSGGVVGSAERSVRTDPEVRTAHNHRRFVFQRPEVEKDQLPSSATAQRVLSFSSKNSFIGVLPEAATKSSGVADIGRKGRAGATRGGQGQTSRKVTSLSACYRRLRKIAELSRDLSKFALFHRKAQCQTHGLTVGRGKLHESCRANTCGADSIETGNSPVQHALEALG